MSDTPETDAAWEELCSNFSRYRIAEKMKTYCQEKERERDEARKSLDEMSKHLAQATAQRDHAETEMRKWMAFAKNVLGERDKAMQNLKLLDIAQWFANHFVDECYELPHEDQELHDRLSLCPVILKARELKAELDQLKEEVK